MTILLYCSEYDLKVLLMREATNQIDVVGTPHLWG